MRWPLLALCLLSLVGCGSTEAEAGEQEAAMAPDRDGYAPQMGVVAGDINDYGN